MIELCMTAAALPPKKKTPQPKHRLPVLNWVAMKSSQVKGTVFSELDDEKLYNVCFFACCCVDYHHLFTIFVDIGFNNKGAIIHRVPKKTKPLNFWQ